MNVRVNLNLDDMLLKRIDKYAEKLGISRTAAVSVLCGEMIEQKEAMVTLGKMVDIVGKEK